MIYDFLYNEEICQVAIENIKGTSTAAVGDKKFNIKVESIAPHVLSLIINDHPHKVTYARNNNDLYIHIKGEIIKFQIPGDDEDLLEVTGGESGDQDLLIKSSMPGSVLKIEVKEGDTVTEGQCLIIVEAMKMETGLYSTITGTVKKIFTELGKQVNSGEVLIELEKNE